MKGTRTCIAPIIITTSKRTDVDHTALPANTPHLPFLRSYKHSLEGDTAQFHPASYTDILLYRRKSPSKAEAICYKSSNEDGAIIPQKQYQ